MMTVIESLYGKICAVQNILWYAEWKFYVFKARTLNENKSRFTGVHIKVFIANIRATDSNNPVKTFRHTRHFIVREIQK